MHNFLANNRDELIARCMASVGQRLGRAADEQQLRKSLPLFLAQLQRTLLAQREDGQAGELLTVSGTAGSDAQALSQVGVTAAAHGKQLLELGRFDGAHHVCAGAGTA